MKSLIIENVFLNAISFIEEAIEAESKLCILTNIKLLQNSLRDPLLSPWKFRFQAKRIVNLLVHINFKLYSDLDDQAKHWIRSAASTS